MTKLFLSLMTKSFIKQKGVIFVNTSRAETKDYIEGLSTGHIKHCAMDVFHENITKNHQFLNSKSVTLTHILHDLKPIDRLLWSEFKIIKIHSKEHIKFK